MPPRVSTSTADLGNVIRTRRQSLGLSIEEAARRAGVTTKTWSRYESGASIRSDKVRGVCRALGWSKLPTHDGRAPECKAEDDFLGNIGTDHGAWSLALADKCGIECAKVFSAGSDFVYDALSEDLESLASEPRGTHIGQLPVSMIIDELPPQFLYRYDYELIYELRAAVARLRNRFVAGSLVAYTVLEELALLLIFSKAELYSEMSPSILPTAGIWREWLGDILGDLDVELYLYNSNWALTPRITYHFDHWREAQFYGGVDSVEYVAMNLGNIYSGNESKEDMSNNK